MTKRQIQKLIHRSIGCTIHLRWRLDRNPASPFANRCKAQLAEEQTKRDKLQEAYSKLI